MKHLNISRNWSILVVLGLMVGTLRFLLADDECNDSNYYGCAGASVTIGQVTWSHRGCSGEPTTNDIPVMRRKCDKLDVGASAFAANLSFDRDEFGNCLLIPEWHGGTIKIEHGGTGCEILTNWIGCEGIWVTLINPKSNGIVTITATVTGDCVYCPEWYDDYCEDCSISERTWTATGYVQVDLQKDECSTGCCGGEQQRQLGTASVLDDSANFMLYLGSATADRDAGYISLHAATPSADLASPVLLRVPFERPGVEVLWTNGTIKQVKSAQGLVHVAVKDNYEYLLQCFYESSLVKDQYGEYVKDAYGFYTTNGLAFNTWSVKNPDGAAANNSLWITDYGSSRDFKYTFTTQNSRWDLVLPDGQTTNSTWNVRYGDYITNYFQVTSGGTLIQKKQNTYKWVTALNDKVLTQEVEGDGGTTRTTSYTYYPGDAGTGNANKLQRVDYPDGNWVYYKYNPDGRVQTEYSALGNNPPPSPDNEPNPSTDLCKVTEHAYTLNYEEDWVEDDGSIFPWQVRRSVVKIPSGGVLREVSRTYHRFITEFQEETQQCPEPGGHWGDAGNLITVVTKDDAGRVVSTTRPDGTTSYMSYGEFTTTESNPETTTTSEVDELGKPLSRTVEDNNTSVVLEYEVYTYTNAFGQYLDPLRRSYDVSDLAGRVSRYRYNDCCGLEYTVNADGQTNHFDYDIRKRQVASTLFYGGSTGVKTTNTLDAVGRVHVAKRIGTDGSVITLQQSLYDVLGRLMCQTNALGGVTTVTNRIVDSRLCITNTYPDGGTRVVTYYRDGRLESVTGTAVNPVRYEYGVEDADPTSGLLWRNYTKEIKLDSSGTDTDEWTKTYEDGVGRAYKTVYPDGAYSQSYFNDHGQLWKQRDPDNVWTLRYFDPYTGREDFTVNPAQSPTTTYGVSDYADLAYGSFYPDYHFGTADRISRTVRTVAAAADGKPDLVRTERFVWDDDQTSGTVVSTSETSADGLEQWQLIPGQDQPTHTEVEYGADGIRTVTTTQPDSTQAVQVYAYGRLASVTQKSSAGAQLLRADYQYDSHGRRYRVIDARNGVSQSVFNNADQATTVITPSPGNSQPARVTTRTFDNMGRSVRTTQPDGTSMTNEYFATGLLKWIYGSHTYPVQYAYDAQGRTTSMKTYKSFSGNPNSPGTAAETTWQFHAQRGWLVKKVYDGETDSTPDYTYTAGGRLKTRVWERGIITTYKYGFDDTTADNQHGDLTVLDYSDSTPDVTQAYDRRGRLKAVTRNGITTTRTYNDSNLLLAEDYTGGSLNDLSTERTYYGSANAHALKLEKVRAKNGSTAQVEAYYTYDTGGRMSQVRDNLDSSYTAEYSYLTDSPLVGSVTFKQSTTTRLATTKNYDYLNRLRSISSAASGETLPLSHAYTYNNANQRTRMTLIDGSYWVYEYDALGQVKSGKRYWSDGTPVAGQQFEYGHDTIGNRTTTAVGGDQNGSNLRSASYVVNSKNQYTSRGVPPYIEVLGIAKVDATVTVEGSSSGVYRHGEYFRKELNVNNASAAQYPTIDVDTDVTSPVSGEKFLPLHPESFTPDADGNLTQDGRWDYVWDGENRLAKMRSRTGSPAPERRIEFEYDWQGRRIRQTVWNDRDDGQGSELSDTLYLYDGWNLIAELNANSSNAKVRTYIWGLDLSGLMQGAGGVGGLLMVIDHTSAKRYFTAYDGNGNVMGLADSTTGKWSARYEYGPFGEVIRANGPASRLNPFRFSTKYQDDETDLLYYGYRYYTASTGRWISRDPIQERGGVALYAFAHNNPISVVDFFGLSFKIIPQTAPPGTLPTDKGRDVLGRTWITKRELIKFSATTEKITCAYCVTLHVDKDYEVEVTSIKPSSIPTGFTENGFHLIESHEDRRAQVYSRAHDAYYEPVKGIIDGKYLCCSEPFSAVVLLNWALDVAKAYEAAFDNYAKSQNDLIETETEDTNLIPNKDGLIDGLFYIYTPGEMPGVGALPPEPNCCDAR